MTKKIFLTTIAISVPLLIVMTISLLTPSEITEKEAAVSDPPDESCAVLLKELSDNNPKEK